MPLIIPMTIEKWQYFGNYHWTNEHPSENAAENPLEHAAEIRGGFRGDLWCAIGATQRDPTPNYQIEQSWVSSIYIYIYICYIIYIYIYIIVIIIMMMIIIYTHIYYRCVCIYIYIYICMRIYIYIYINTCICIPMIYVYNMCVCIYIYIYICIHMWAFALQSRSRNSSPAPGLVLWQLVILWALVSGGVLFSQTPALKTETHWAKTKVLMLTLALIDSITGWRKPEVVLVKVVSWRIDYFPESYIIYIHTLSISWHKYIRRWNHIFFRKPPFLGPPSSCAKRVPSLASVRAFCHTFLAILYYIITVDIFYYDYSYVLLVIIITIYAFIYHAKVIFRIDRFAREPGKIWQHLPPFAMYIYIYIHIYIYVIFYVMSY